MSASDLILDAGAPATRARVRVPATSANLGCGFDSLGMALTLYNEFLFEAAPQLSFEGCEARFANDHHLAYTTWRRTLRSLADESRGSAALCDPAKVHLSCASQVPLSGGLGSSSTCIVAGIVAAYAMAGVALAREELLERATRAEGHPDNVAPASLGGLTCVCLYIIPWAQPFSRPAPSGSPVTCSETPSQLLPETCGSSFSQWHPTLHSSSSGACSCLASCSH